MADYRTEKTFEERQSESARMRERYPGRVCVFITKEKSCKLPDITKRKYLVPSDLSVGQLIHVIRKRATISATDAIFLFTERNIAPPTTMSVAQLYKEAANADGFLYLSYNTEATFGNSFMS
jgi:GABA(A) receptor-associated protein